MSKQTELAQVADTITVDSGNVGIGVLSPASAFLEGAALDVGGPVLARGAVAIHHTNASVFQYNSNTTSIRSYGATANSGEITFTTGGGGTADSERMRIDSAGRVTKPYQPSFFASGNQGFQTTASGGTIVLDTISFNVGSHYSTSTGRFTAPVAGKYFVSFTSYTQSTGTMTLKKNGSDFIVTDVAFLYLPNNVSARSGGISGLIHLNANDYIHFGARNNQQVYYYQGHTTFSAFLIG